MRTALVIDDHPVTHMGCDPILRDAGFENILEAQDSETGLKLAMQHKPELIVLDLELPDVQGLTLIERLLTDSPTTKVLVFSMHDDPMFPICALGAGAHGYLTKNTPPEEFLEAVEAVLSGRTYLAHALATELAVSKARGDSNPFWHLKPRELQVLQLLGSGKSHGEIAEQLGVGYKTVVNICAHLKAKLDMESLVDLVRLAIETLPPRDTDKSA